MCSGCSGYFEGDGEDRELGDSDLFEREDRLSGRFPTGRDALREESGDFAMTTRDGDDYEVLVSAECIIERRTIRANCRAVSLPGAPEANEMWNESRRERERSLAASAKHYQTLAQFDSEGRAKSSPSGRCLTLWCLAGVTALALVLWLAVG